MSNGSSFLRISRQIELKEAINTVESKTVTMSDCYNELIKFI